MVCIGEQLEEREGLAHAQLRRRPRLPTLALGESLISRTCTDTEPSSST